ncbi:MAG TPA: glycosyltransferase family 10 [Leptolyngbyaceae cyanobacterium]
MNKKRIKIKFTNGLNFVVGMRDILNFLTPYYEFIDSDEPDFVIFGPYGNDIPQGNFVRIGYYCENIIPDLTICDWAFGIPYEEKVNNPRYMRIQWHGFDPESLIKKDINVEKIMAEKTKFCNFIYSHRVPFREKFYKVLAKYKPIDAPGKSMKNIDSIDTAHNQGDIWQRKKKFLSQYKFTIAFENYSYPGYNTEKLLDPMNVNSLPIYWGNPHIALHFNTKSFINAHEYMKINDSLVVNLLESLCYPDFKDIRPGMYRSLSDRVKRKLKSIGREIKINLQYTSFNDLIEKIIEIDKNDTLYKKYLLEPWLYQNTPPPNPAISRWKEIFG